MRYLFILVAAMLLSLQAETVLMRWDAQALFKDWTANDKFADLRYEDGHLKGRVIKHDPQFFSPLFTYQAAMLDEIHLRLKTSQPGPGQLYYACDSEPPNEGFRAEQVANFNIRRANEWMDIRFRPMFAVSKPIVHFRLDLPDDVTFEIDFLEVIRHGETKQSTASRWQFKNNQNPEWFVTSDGWHCAPNIKLDTMANPYLQLGLQTPVQARVKLCVITDEGGRINHEFFTSPYDKVGKRYCFDLRNHREWKGTATNLMLQIVTEHAQPYALTTVALAPQPPVYEDVSILFFGAENYPNRVTDNNFYKDGNRVLLKVKNLAFHETKVEVRAEGLNEALTATLDAEEIHTFVYHVKTDKPATVTPRAAIWLHGHGDKKLTVVGKPYEVTVRPTLHDGSNYVPEPKPAKTDYLIGSYYYPGYGVPRQWRQMARYAPQTKPVLGYYDEGNPECIDWQIKWAVEHGVSFFLVDWYWSAGRMHNEHWLDGFAKARHRRYMKWALMWANHNPPNTHSREDWINVVNRWLTHYMNTDEYLRINGKPVVFIWSPLNLIRDMKGTQAVAELFKLADKMAVEAGLPGMDFYAMGSGSDEDRAACGYVGFTNYHWWNSAPETSHNPRFYSYKAVVDGAEERWNIVNDRMKAHGMRFLPVIDTGWDARPRHGMNTHVIYDRTPQEFLRLLKNAKTWMDSHQEKIGILGPWNEWTEGSYIEPCSEWGFDMLRGIRQVFCQETVQSDDTSPFDLWGASHKVEFDMDLNGMKRTEWDFKGGQSLFNWRRLMGLDELKLTARGMETKSTTRDPAIVIDEVALKASDFQALEVVLSVSPLAPNDKHYIALFWGSEASPITGESSKTVPLKNTAEPTKYVVPLAGHPLWKGKITTLRFDPIQSNNKTIIIESIKLIPAR